MGVPQNIIVPFVGIEFDASKAGGAQSGMPFNALLMGHKNTGAITADNVPTLILNAGDAAKKFGIGSLIHMLAERWFSRNIFTPVYAISVPEPTGTVSNYTLTFAGTASSSGEVAVYVDGVRFSAPVAVGDASATIATALKDAINASPEKTCFTATAVTGTLTLATRYKGTTGNAHDVRTTYYDTDFVPQGLTITSAVASGTGTVDISAAITAINNRWYAVIASPFDDNANLGLMETELERRFGPTVQQDGMLFIGNNLDAGNAITFATNSLRNSQSVCLVDAYRYTQHKAFVATLVASEVAKSVQSDPGKPVHRISINNLLPPVASQRYDMPALNTLTTNGIFTLDPNAFGGPQTFGTVTMYLKNLSGMNDTAYQYVNTMFILQKLRYSFVAEINAKYARSRLADSADRIRSGISVITPKTGKAEAIAIARGWEADGLVENIDSFKDQIICQRSPSNPNRLEWILPPDLVNQFIVGSGDMQFKLQ